ncbi:MAG: AsmA family protein [Kiritimatiellia bacterium]
MKSAKRFAIILVIAIAVILIAAALFLSPLVKTAVEKGAPPMLGVPVTLDKPGINLLAGKINLKNLVVGNPEGYKTDYAFKLGQFKIDMQMSTLGSDTMVIKDILIDGPEICYEMGLGNSNIGTILDHLKKQSPDGKPEAEKEEKAGQVQIDNFVISGAKLRVSAKMMGGQAVTIPLPTIHLKDLGKKDEGASITDVITEVMNAVAGAIAEAVAGAPELLGKGFDAAMGVAGDGITAAGTLADEGVRAASGIAADGAKAAGEIATEGVKAVGEGAGALIKGVGGLLPGGKDKK